MTSANGQMHINDLDANGHVHELVYKEPSWQALRPDRSRAGATRSAAPRQCAGGRQ